MAADRTYRVIARWDEEAGVWVATSDDIQGLATEASSVDVLMEKLKRMVPELLELNDEPEPLFDGWPFSLELPMLAERSGNRVPA